MHTPTKDRTPRPQVIGRGAARITRRRMLQGSGAMLAALGLIGATGGGPTPALAQAARKDAGRPVIVLVHGAWADGSSWAGVIARLADEGYTVVAPAVGLGSLSADVAAVRKFIADIGAPALVVGHSYGGAVISGAASGLANVVGLVYAAAFAPDSGESLLSLTGQFDQQYGPVPAAQFYRPDGPFDADHPQTLIYLDRANFAAVFAQDVERERAAVMAATQRPIALASFVEPLGVAPAWRQLPTWYQISADDRMISPDGERLMAARMGATTIELPSSHASPVAHPRAIARLIERAARAV